VTAKVDTAADVSGLPQELVERLRLPPTRRVRTSTYRGEPTEARLHRGDLTVAGRRFTNVEWLPIGRPYALLGRNVVNDLVLELDGPRFTIEVRRKPR
jgi:predicted aspartyl protease